MIEVQIEVISHQSVFQTLPCLNKCVKLKILKTHLSLHNQLADHPLSLPQISVLNKKYKKS